MANNITPELCEALCKLTEAEWIALRIIVNNRFLYMGRSDEFKKALRVERQRTMALTPEELLEQWSSSSLIG